MPGCMSPISPSSSALGVSAATESTTSTSMAPERTSVSAISSACSPVSGWEIRRSVDLHPELARIDGIERMLGVDEAADAAGLLRLRHHLQRERGLAGQFRAVNLDDAPARQAADAECDVEAEGAGGDRLDVHGLIVGAEPHDRALAVHLLDLRERVLQRLHLVHRTPFDHAEFRLRHHVRSPYGMRVMFSISTHVYMICSCASISGLS